MVITAGRLLVSPARAGHFGTHASTRGKGATSIVCGKSYITTHYRTHALQTGRFLEQIDAFRHRGLVTYGDRRRPKSFRHGRK